MIKFGPAGNSLSFYEQGGKSTVQAMPWIAELGLNAYEYSCGKGINVGEDTALKIGAAAAECGVEVSVHAPYYTNLANPFTDKREATNRYIIGALKVARLMGGSRVVFHPGAYMKRKPSECMDIALMQMRLLMRDIDAEGLGDMTVCPETMGKQMQLGTVDEVLALCSVDERIIPCVDFGHLYARSLGETDSFEAFDAILCRIANALGEERMKSLHIHFSQIEYTKGGEKRHCTMDDSWGPHFEYLARALVKHDAHPVIICESAGTMAEDAVTMQKIYRQCLN